VDLVKAFCQVHFGEINGAMAGVSFQDVAEQVVQGVAKLHGFLGRNGEGFLVKAGVRIINNRLGLMVALGDYAHGAEAQVREVGNAVKGEDHPLAHPGHVGKVSSEEGEVVLGRFVGATLEGHTGGLSGVCRESMGRGQDDGSSMVTILDEGQCAR